MRIEYRRYETPRAQTWFAKIRRADREWLKTRITEALIVASQFSVDQDSEIWQTFQRPDREQYGRSGWHRGKSNCIMSVLGGALGKISGGGDLTEKQVLQVTRAFEQLHQIDSQVFPRVEFSEVSEYSTTGSSLEDLRSRLFDDA
jgi:hypothetical protein